MQWDTPFSEPWSESAVGTWLTGSHYVTSFEEPADRDWLWSASDNYFSWQVANVDLSLVTGFTQAKAKPANVDFEPLWGTIEELEPSNLSRLVRVVRDWSFDVEEEMPLAIVSDPPYADAGGTFFSRLHESQHELLQREAGKELWAWFADWREAALELAECARALSGRKVLGMLKRALAARRSAPRVRPPRQRHAPAERLLRLAETICPHAPPLPLLTELLPMEAG